jgi:cytoskeletal protein RodZ
MRRAVTGLAILAVVLTGAVGCRSVTGQSLGTNIDNQTLKASVKSKLAREKITSLTRIGVDANEGVVYLTGNVESPEMKQRAEQIARQQDGVRRVVNNIVVDEPKTSLATTPPGQTAQSQPTTQSQAPATSSASASPSAAPATMVSRQMVGEVTEIDHARGHVNVRTPEREMELYVPPAALQNIQKGDRVNVEIGIRPVR